jgi:hypothetical protein
MCRTAFIREVFVMGRKRERRERGIFKHNAPEVKVADFSYQNDEIANLIVRCWLNTGNIYDQLVGPNTPMQQRKDNAKNALAALPSGKAVRLTSCIVITEDEYNDGWVQDDDDQIVFVLPSPTRQTGNLVETAKLLMACVPNGI